MERNPVFPRSIQYLMAVAEHQSFTRAAEALYVSQPTLSQQIRQLEDLLDTQLLDRSGRVVRLTAAGEVYLQYAYRALRELEAGTRAIYDLQDLSRGSLRLGMMPVTDYLTTPLLHEFIARYPGINVSTTEMSQDDIAAALTEDRIDVGVSYNCVLANDKHPDDIDTQTLCVERLSLAVGCDHDLAQEIGPLNSIEVLEREPMVMLNNNYALRRHIDSFCFENSIKLTIAMEATSVSLITEVVRLGRLATILPDVICSAQPRLHQIPMTPELPRHGISLFFRKSAYKSPACVAFGELASELTSTRCRIKQG
ncbi:transcriptional regulator CynR [Halochromatium roseum]|uniref:transcriptional regulator CynR n=1 Tax=Halochromatium roseum TaxID=391920 RepID=UPI0019130A7D|nr:transcriptional regulator CynR [Halochromatium roseum]MBK5938778.1 transcriptional regulator CynR [Halochromatium roseum]